MHYLKNIKNEPFHECISQSPRAKVKLVSSFKHKTCYDINIDI